MQSKQFMRLFRVLGAIVPVLVLAACGGGEGQERIEPTPPPASIGILVDSPVSGVTYSTTSGLSGETSTDGEFEYRVSDIVTFSIGDIVLGSAPGAPYLTSVELTGSADPTEQAAINQLVFLQSIDADEDPGNGITISAATRDAAIGQTLDFNSPNFAAEVQVVVAAITEPDNAIVSDEQALNNFYETYAALGGTDTFDFPFPGYPPVGTQFELIFADEFNTGTAPNPEVWNYDIGYGPNNFGWGNNEWQLYTDDPENIRVEGGNLVITALCPVAPCDVRDGSITSARITTTDKFEFRYGKIVARIKVPTGQGTWPAFWALGANFPEIGWPRSGEIDFMEVFNNTYNTPPQEDIAQRTATSAMHWCDERIVTDPNANCFPAGRIFEKGELTLEENIGNDFRIWEADWGPDKVTVSIDGVQYFELDIDPQTMEEFRRDFFLLLNVAVGGTLGSGGQPPQGDETFPQTMLVDYVRVFQQVETGPAEDTIIDFENAPESYGFENFEGGVSVVLPNPVSGGINTSSQVARMQKFAGADFAGSKLNLPSPVEITQAGNATMKVWSPRPVNVLLKLEGPANIERNVAHGGSGWEELTYDFSTFTGTVEGTTVIFDLGTVGDAEGDPDNWTFYYDDITLPTGEDVITDPPPTLPEVILTSGNPAEGFAKAGDFVSLAFTASEPITTPTVLIGGAPADFILGSGVNWRASRVINESVPDGELTFNISFTDLELNEGVPVTMTTDGSMVIVDKIAPVLAVTGAPAMFASLDPISLTFQFSEAVNGFELGDIGVTNGSVRNLSGTAATYTADVVPNGFGDLVVTIAAGAAADPAGNPIAAPADTLVMNGLDPDAPLLTAISISSSNGADAALASAGDTVTLTMTANEPITQPSVQIAGTVASVTGADASYEASVTLAGTEAEGPIAFAIGGFEDLGGTAGYESTFTTDSSVVVVDLTPPTLDIEGVPDNLAFVEPVNVTFVFAEDVLGFDLGDIAVTNGAAADFVAVDAATYTAVVSPDGAGDLIVAVAENAANDIAGNGNVGASVTGTVSDTRWQLVFVDDFDAEGLDAGAWTARTDGDCPDPCDGEQIYLAEQVAVADGVLTITAQPDGGSGFNSGLIDTRGKFEFTFGRVEVDAWMPGTVGTLPTLFLLPASDTYGPWPQSGEIDIVNAPNLGPSNSTLEHSLRYGLPVPEDTITTSTSEPPTDPTLSFLQYAIEWEGNEIRWFVNDVHVATQIADNWYTYTEDADGVFGIGEGNAPFDQNFYLAIGLPIGGEAGALSTFPQELIVEAVRIYECANPTTPAGTGCSTGTGVPPEDAPGEPYVESLPVYTDALATLDFEAPGGSTESAALAADSFASDVGVVVTSTLNAPDGVNTVWNVNIDALAGSGGVSAKPGSLTTGLGFFDLTGGDTAGEILFRMRVNSATGGPALLAGLQASSGSGRSALTYTADGVWRNYSVKIDAVVADSVNQGTALSVGNLSDIFVLEAAGGAIDLDLDDISVKVACREEGGCEATPKVIPLEGTVQFAEDFESLSLTAPDALSNEGWVIFGSVFDAGGNFKFGYGTFPAPNNPDPPGWAALVNDQGGAEQGTQQLSVFSDYNCCQPGEGHFNGTDLVESNIFQEWTIGGSGDSFPSLNATVTFTFDAKRGNIEGSTEAIAFIKTIDPGAGFALTNFVIAETTNTTETWDSFTISLDLTDPLLEGQLLQVGFASTTSNFEGSGVFYDNIEVSTTPAAP